MNTVPLLSVFCVALSCALADVRVPAFTAYLEPESGGASVSENAGITRWTDPGQRVVWFGHFSQPGKLNASVVVRCPKGARSKLKLTIDNQTHEAVAAGKEGETIVPFGTFDLRRAGYASMTLTSANRKGEPAAEVIALLLSGPAAEGAHFNLEPRRNAASVHLSYTLPKGADLDAFYAEVTALEDPIYTFYMACGFQRGYFGMQLNGPKERRIIFSVWDSGEGQKAMKRDGVAEEDRTRLLTKGEGVVANAFGNEGTGGHSHLVYPWKTGERQRFLLTSKPAENGSAIYSGYWFHPEKRAWMLIARFQAPKASAALAHFHSFSENFGGSNGQLRRKALYANQWVHVRGGAWQEITEASFSHDPTGKSARLDRMMGVERGAFFLAHGGFVDGTTPSGEKFTRRASGQAPSDIDFSKLEALR